MSAQLAPSHAQAGKHLDDKGKKDKLGLATDFWMRALKGKKDNPVNL